jgi:hypothetical protein
MNLTLHIWRQKNASDKGKMVRYDAKNVNPDMSFLEMLDVLNDELILKGEEPIVFEHDCREGICGSCGFMINGVAHGPTKGTAICQLHMRHYKDGDVLYLEPFRAKAFPPHRAGYGCGCLYSVWRLYRGLSERIGCAIHGREDFPSRFVAARSAGAGTPCFEDGGAGKRGTVWKLHEYRRV